eukprot:593040-Alexandrium_andersonii.AAC.1
MPPLCRVSGFPDVRDALYKALSKPVRTIEATQYTFDALCLVNEVESAVRRQVTVKLVIDKA